MKTTTVETSQLSAAALDWAVAKAVGHKFQVRHREIFLPNSSGAFVREFSPSADWSQGGPMIEKYRVWIASTCTRGEEWDATVSARTFVDAVGPTPLIAACRAIVAAELGDDVEVPAELVEASDA